MNGSDLLILVITEYCLISLIGTIPSLINLKRSPTSLFVRWTSLRLYRNDLNMPAMYEISGFVLFIYSNSSLKQTVCTSIFMSSVNFSLNYANMNVCLQSIWINTYICVQLRMWFLRDSKWNPWLSEWVCWILFHRGESSLRSKGRWWSIVLPCYQCTL